MADDKPVEKKVEEPKVEEKPPEPVEEKVEEKQAEPAPAEEKAPAEAVTLNLGVSPYLNLTP